MRIPIEEYTAYRGIILRHRGERAVSEAVDRIRKEHEQCTGLISGWCDQCVLLETGRGERRVTDLLQHALGYATLGLEIFPVGPNKRPLHSQLDATTDLDQIEAWWKQWPDALIGHRIAPDVVLLDVDPRHGGKATWNALKVEASLNGARPRTHFSGRNDGGGHIWFKRPAERVTVVKLDAWAQERELGIETGGRWTSGIDLLRHEHRYTILPPSPHPETQMPYRWAPGKGLNVDPGLMPTYLAELLTKDEPAAPTSEGPTYRQVDSIADWFSENHSWGQILEPRGWTLVNGDGDQDGSEWRHPKATNEMSATIRHECLFVYSSNTPFVSTEPDEPHGYTRFSAYALLNHAGDLKAAGGAARRLKGPAVVDTLTPKRLNGVLGTSGTTEQIPDAETANKGVLPAVAVQLPDDFWSARPALAHIRQAAHSRQRSADAVLHVVLARLSAIVPHTLLLPAVVGTAKPLCYFVAVVAPPGMGKGDANGIGADLVEAPEWVSDQIPPGSGEGLAELLFDLVEDVDEKGHRRKVKRQVRHNAYVYADEGQVISDLGSRSGSVLLPSMRTIWSGGPLGQANANVERRRMVPALSYSFGIVAGFQIPRVGPLLDDADAGTPQRFAWAYAVDSTIPDDIPSWPGSLEWSVPPVITGDDHLGLNVAIAREIRAADLARVRGQVATDVLDAQGGLFRLKVAGLLAVLDGRRSIRVDDWDLAGMVKTASDAVRTRVGYDVQSLTGQESARRREAFVRREVEADAAKEHRRVVDGARKIADKVSAEPERWTVADLRRDARRWREVFDDALDHAKIEGWVKEVEIPGQGTAKRGLRPGNTS